MSYLGMNQETGQRIEGSEHLAQSEARILTTPLSTRAMRRPFGSELPRLIGRVSTEANQQRLVAAAVDAIQRWEPRAHVVRVVLRETATRSPVIEVQHADGFLNSVRVSA